MVPLESFEPEKLFPPRMKTCIWFTCGILKCHFCKNFRKQRLSKEEQDEIDEKEEKMRTIEQNIMVHTANRRHNRVIRMLSEDLATTCHDTIEKVGCQTFT